MTDIEVTTKVSVETSGGRSVNHLQESAKLYDPIITDETRRVLNIVFYVFLTGPISVLGSVANVISIIIFLQQGFKYSVNISLCSLAVADVGALLPLVWKSICINPLFQYSDIRFDTVQIQQVTGGWPHDSFVRIRSWITAYITFERCVSIALPLKVKNIITPKRTFISMFIIFVLMLAIVAPIFCTISLSPLFHVQRNLTLIGVLHTNNGRSIETISFSISVVAQLSSFIIVIVCTVILISNLIAKSQWQHTAKLVSSSDAPDKVSSRDKRVMKMITIIACIFIVCLLPNAVNIILMVHLSPAYNVAGIYHNAFLMSWAILNTCEAVNSSINIIILYKMSSKFRTTFHKLF